MRVSAFSAFLGTGPGHSRELGAAERHRKVGRGQISTYIGDLPGPSLLPLVLQLQLTAHCSKCVALGQQGDSPNFPGSLIPLCL